MLQSRLTHARPRLGALWTLLVVLALVASSSVGALAQQATPAASPVASGDGPGIGDAVVLFDNRGREQAQVAVLDVVDPFEDVESDSQRGFHYVAVEVAVQNLTDAAYSVDAYSIRLVDGEGTLYTGTYAFRTEESRAAVADLASADLAAGATTSGYLVYEVVDGATPVAVLSTNGYETFTVLADLSGIAPAAGAPATLYDDRGREIGSISLDKTLPALEDTSDAFDVSRGETAFGAVVTIENTGTRPITPDLYSMYVVDEFGYLYNATTFYRDAQETSAPPDFPTDDIAGGDSASGLVAFTLPVDVKVSYLLYVPGGSQLFVVAQPGDGPTISGDTLTPVPPVGEGVGTPVGAATPIDGDTGGDTGLGTDATATGEESAECAALDPWAAATRENLAVLSDNPIFQADTAAGITADQVHDAADQVRDAADAQSALDVPDLAVDTNDAIVAFFGSFADALDEAANQIDDGADPQKVFTEDLIGENSQAGRDLAALAAAEVPLTTTCPNLDIGL